MRPVPGQAGTAAHDSPPGPGGGGEARPRHGTLLDLSALDLTQRLLSRKDLERWNPHRGDMSLLDWVIWQSPDYTRGVAIKHIRPDEFWVPGHFPDHPLFPGVLMVEAAAQLACYLYNVRQPVPRTVAFTRIDNTSFRAMVQPGDDLYVLCREVKYQRRRFVSDVQGVVNGRIAFDGQISGMAVDG